MLSPPPRRRSVTTWPRWTPGGPSPGLDAKLETAASQPPLADPGGQAAVLSGIDTCPGSPPPSPTTPRDARMRRDVKWSGQGGCDFRKVRAGEQVAATIDTLVCADRDRRSWVRRKLPRTKNADLKPHSVREDPSAVHARPLPRLHGTTAIRSVVGLQMNPASSLAIAADGHVSLPARGELVKSGGRASTVGSGAGQHREVLHGCVGRARPRWPDGGGRSGQSRPGPGEGARCEPWRSTPGARLVRSSTPKEPGR